MIKEAGHSDSGSVAMDEGMTYGYRWLKACWYAHRLYRQQPLRCWHAVLETGLQWLLYSVLVSVVGPAALSHSVALLWLLLWSSQLSWLFSFISEQDFVESYQLERLQVSPGLRWRSGLLVAWLWQSTLLCGVVLPFAALVLRLDGLVLLRFMGVWILQSPALLLWAMLSRLILFAMPQSLLVSWLITLPWVLPLALWTETLMMASSWGLSVWPVLAILCGWQWLTLLGLPALMDSIMAIAYLRHWVSTV